MNRIVTAHTPLAPQQLKFRSMHGHEAISQLFEFDLELVSESFSLDMKALLGQPLTLEIETSALAPRYLNGQITRCALAGKESATSLHYIYRLTVRPWLWYLTQTTDSKIFQNKSVPDVLDEVLGDYGFPVSLRLTGAYRSWEYCVQYQETDFAFVSRLMEHEGIYYWFEHENGQHTLVLSDDAAQHEVFPGYESLPFYGSDRAVVPREEYISGWEVAEEITPGGFATVDYDFRKPAASLDARRHNPSAHAHGDLEVYEWLGGYTDAEQGEHYSRVRLEQLQGRQEQVSGYCNARGLAPGRRFTLRNHPRSAENREYLVVAVRYRIQEGGYASGSNAANTFDIGFTVQPSSLQYRAPRVTPLPHTHGPQTARVVGPAGEEIWTDQYGRIKVHFHWDRYGQRNQNSSCWVRVSSPWAGGGFGGIQLPRVGDEVIVDFIGGHPDRPIVIGRVYNAGNMPPWNLPDNATQSGFLSRSKDGTPSNANALMFEDKPGSELIWLHAELDLNTEVERNETHSVDGWRNTTIQGDDTTVICGHRNITVRQTDTLTVDGTREVTVGEKETYLVKGPRDLTVSGGMTTESYEQGLTTTVADSGEKRTITGLFDETLNDGEKREVKTKSDVKVDGEALHHVTGPFTETIDGAQTITVNNSAAAYNVTGGTYTQTVSDQVRIESTGSGIEITASGPIKVISSGDNVVIEGETVKQTARASEWKVAPTSKEFIYFSKISVGTLKNDAWASTLSWQGAKTDVSGSKVDAAIMSHRATGTERQIKGLSFDQSAVATYVALLTAFL